jgi:hypothetical protein
MVPRKDEREISLKTDLVPVGEPIDRTPPPGVVRAGQLHVALREIGGGIVERIQAPFGRHKVIEAGDAESMLVRGIGKEIAAAEVRDLNVHNPAGLCDPVQFLHYRNHIVQVFQHMLGNHDIELVFRKRVGRGIKVVDYVGLRSPVYVNRH